MLIAQVVTADMRPAELVLHTYATWSQTRGRTSACHSIHWIARDIRGVIMLAEMIADVSVRCDVVH